MLFAVPIGNMTADASTKLQNDMNTLAPSPAGSMLCVILW